MIDAATFTTNEEYHFVEIDGEWWLVSKEFADLYGKQRPSAGTAVVSRVDPVTNTIWFSSPIPKSVHV